MRGFLRVYDVPPREARAIFVETLKLLWLAGTSKEPLTILVQLKVLDEMWHAFILHTDDYARFCRAHFGRFLHHDPETRTRRGVSLVSEDEVERIVARVYFTLGKRTAQRWFETYPKRYSEAFLEAARRRRAREAPRALNP